MNTRSLMPLLAAAAVCTSTVLAFAGDAAKPDIEEALKSGEILPLDAIIKAMTERYPGRVTEIELGSKKGRYLYEIDVVNDRGLKIEFKLDAKSGKLLSSKLDDDDDKAKKDSDDDDDSDDDH
jgi:hypothetical protein